MSGFGNSSQTYSSLCRPVGLTLSPTDVLRMFILNCMQIKLCAYCH